MVCASSHSTHGLEYPYHYSFTATLLIGFRQGSFYLLLQEEDRLLEEDANEVGDMVDLYVQVDDPC